MVWSGVGNHQRNQAAQPNETDMKPSETARNHRETESETIGTVLYRGGKAFPSHPVSAIQGATLRARLRRARVCAMAWRMHRGSTANNSQRTVPLQLNEDRGRETLIA